MSVSATGYINNLMQTCNHKEADTTMLIHALDNGDILPAWYKQLTQMQQLFLQVNVINCLGEILLQINGWHLQTHSCHCHLQCTRKKQHNLFFIPLLVVIQLQLSQFRGLWKNPCIYTRFLHDRTFCSISPQHLGKISYNLVCLECINTSYL